MAIAIAYLRSGNVEVRRTNETTFTIFLSSNQRLHSYNPDRVYIITDGSHITEYDETCTVRSSYFLQ